MVERARDLDGPFSGGGPVFAEPLNAALKAANLNVCTIENGRELFRVTENTPAHRRLANAFGFAVAPGEADQVVDCAHRSVIGNSTVPVNGDITGREEPPRRSFYRSMDLKGILDRIGRRLSATEQTAAAASRAAKKPDAIRNLQRAVKDGARSGISTATLAALASVLETTEAWLLSGVGPEDPRSEGEPMIPVWGQAGAGGAIVRFHETSGEIDRIRAPEDANERTGAVEIVGDSLGALFNRWYAVYDEVRDPPTRDLYNQLCIIETGDGRVMIKKLKKGRGKRFTLEANYDPPIYDVEVRWAARVKNLVPR